MDLPLMRDIRPGMVFFHPGAGEGFRSETPEVIIVMFVSDLNQRMLIDVSFFVARRNNKPCIIKWHGQAPNEPMFLHPWVRII